MGGRNAAEQGKDREACQLSRGTIYYDDWMDGFEDGERTRPLVSRKEEEGK